MAWGRSMSPNFSILFKTTEYEMLCSYNFEKSLGYGLSEIYEKCPREHYLKWDFKPTKSRVKRKISISRRRQMETFLQELPEAALKSSFNLSSFNQKRIKLTVLK